MNDAPNAAMIEFWNGDAGHKWVRLQAMLDASLMPLGERAMAAAAMVAAERVIDVGCGCGDTSVELARRVGAGGQVLGVDISEPMLAQAKARAAAEGNVEIEKGDAQTYRFAKAAFDIVFSRFGVMFFDDPVAAFRNLGSALRPGGRVAFVCWRPARDNPWLELPMKVVAHHVPLPVAPAPGEPGEFAFADADRVERILTDAGLAAIAIAKHDAPFAIGGDGGLDQTVAFLMNMGPTGRAIAEADPDQTLKSRIAAALRDALAPHDTGNGVVLDAATWIVTAAKP